MTEPAGAAVRAEPGAGTSLRIVIVGHASFHLTAGSTSLLVDPWLFGSCYWRSWWHFPPPPEIDQSWLRPKFLYLSHHHFDHFHYPSLRRIDPETHILVPRFGVDVMRQELASLGFHRVTELRHGKPFELGDGISVRSYQYGVDDSALVVRRGNTVIADLNDCKIRRRALRQIAHDHGPVTMMLKNYSAAQAYPGCYRASRPEDLQLISRQGYLVDFRDAARELQARYAIPFASMTCFLHPETFARNQEVILPVDLEQFFGTNPVAGTELVVMAPGDSWSEERGFALLDEHPYACFNESVATMAKNVAPKIELARVQEAATPLTYERFSEFFSRFVRSLPLPVRQIFRGTVVFAVGEEFWVVDVRHRKVLRQNHRPPDWASLVRVPEGVLADAIQKKIVNFVHISMRLSIELNANGTQTDFAFWGVLTVYELGYFPLHRLPPLRVGTAAWSRWREILDSIRALLGGGGTGLERMAGSLMPTGSQPTSEDRPASTT